MKNITHIHTHTNTHTQGDPDVPMCGFSRQVSMILQNLKVYQVYLCVCV
jgi:glutaredoxin-related protein